MKGFEAQASNAVLDFTGDDDNLMRKKKNLMRWDVKKKKYVKAEQVFSFYYILPFLTRALNQTKLILIYIYLNLIQIFDC